MGEISLQNMHFYSHHGYYTHERKRGNNYYIDVSLIYDFEASAQEDDLDKTVNYEVVYTLTREEMDKPQQLIETVARNIALAILDKFPAIEELEVRVRKENPELGGPVDFAEVAYYYPED